MTAPLTPGPASGGVGPGDTADGSPTWAERYETPCENGCLTSRSGHAEGCPVHCGCYEATDLFWALRS